MTISAAKITLSFCQLASVVVQEGEESHTTNVCQKCWNDSLHDQKKRQKCYNDSLRQKEKTLTNWQWREFAGQKAHRGRLWKMMGKEQYVREMCEYFRQARARVKKFPEEAEEE